MKTLNGEKINNLLENKQDATVFTSIPKFETEYDISLKEVLESIGMVNAFDSGKADFTGLGTSTDGNIYISRVLHKTFISIDENEYENLKKICKMYMMSQVEKKDIGMKLH